MTTISSPKIVNLEINILRWNETAITLLIMCEVIFEILRNDTETNYQIGAQISIYKYSLEMVSSVLFSGIYKFSSGKNDIFLDIYNLLPLNSYLFKVFLR